MPEIAVVATSGVLLMSAPQPPSSFCAETSHLSGRSMSGSVRVRSGVAVARTGNERGQRQRRQEQSSNTSHASPPLSEGTHEPDAKDLTSSSARWRRSAASTSRAASLRF